MFFDPFLKSMTVRLTLAIKYVESTGTIVGIRRQPAAWHWLSKRPSDSGTGLPLPFLWVHCRHLRCHGLVWRAWVAWKQHKQLRFFVGRLPTPRRSWNQCVFFMYFMDVSQDHSFFQSFSNVHIIVRRDSFSVVYNDANYSIARYLSPI